MNSAKVPVLRLVLSFHFNVIVAFVFGGAGPNGIDIEVLRHHTVSISNFQCIKVSTDDWMVHF